jgi:hypothetical protein
MMFLLSSCPFVKRKVLPNGRLFGIQPVIQEHGPGRHDRVQLVLSVDNMNAGVSGRESLNIAAEPGRDLLEIDVFDVAESVQAKNRCNASRLEACV